MRLRVGLNLLHAVPDIGGGWNYIENLLAALAADTAGHEYVAFCNTVSAKIVPDADRFRVKLMPIHAGSRAQRVLFEHTVLAPVAWQHRIDCMHWFANGQGVINWCPAVVTVYDMQPFLEHSRISAGKRKFLQWNLRRAARHAARLLPMSQTTADALQQTLGADPERMTIVPPVLEPAFRVAEHDAVERFRERHGLPAQFWLYVAHFYPHKNHERLLLAYKRLRTAHGHTWPLVLRGDYPDEAVLTDLTAKLGLQGDVVMLPRFKRDELPELYGAASALIFPSLYEGAGMPVLEAQACGCPVVGSDIAAVREFAGDAVLYFDPSSVEAIEQSMARIAAEPALRSSLRAAGLTRTMAYRRIDVVDRLHDAYRRAGGTKQ